MARATTALLACLAACSHGARPLKDSEQRPLRSDRLDSYLKAWSESENAKLEADIKAWEARGGSAGKNLGADAAPGSTLTKVTLPDSYAETYGSSCLDGSPFAYYIRMAEVPSTKWVFFLQGGGLCVEPVDCRNRQASHQGSSDEQYWGETYAISTDGAQDLLSDDHDANPEFYSYNHVFMPYCTGDTWSGTRNPPLAPEHNDFIFAGHFNINATVSHLAETVSLTTTATDVLLSGSSAGGIGAFANADFFYEHYFDSAVNVKTAPVAGAYFPGPVVFYEEWIAGVTATVNDLASSYLTWWFGTAFDESCAAALGPDDQHRCWDYSSLYNHIASPLFVAENKYDQNQINDVLLCPTSRNNSRTNGFVKEFGEIMAQGLLDTVQSEHGVSKGDGLFSPSCFDHTSAFCMEGGQVIELGDDESNEIRLRDMLPRWFTEGTASDGAAHQLVDTCESDMPCNQHCEC